MLTSPVELQSLCVFLNTMNVIAPHRPSKFNARKIQLTTDTTVTVNVFETEHSRYFVTISFRQFRNGDTWNTALSVSLNPQEFAWLTSGTQTPVGSHGRVEITKEKKEKDNTTLARVDYWSRTSSGETRERKIFVPPSLFSALKEKLSEINEAVSAAEEYVETCKSNQYRSDKAVLGELIVALAIRIATHMRKQFCVACLEQGDAPNQEVHVCMSEQPGLCETAFDSVTLDQLASVLASNGYGLPTVSIREIIGDNRDSMILCVNQQIMSTAARNLVDRHTTVQQPLFQVHPTASSWNAGSST